MRTPSRTTTITFWVDDDRSSRAGPGDQGRVEPPRCRLSRRLARRGAGGRRPPQEGGRDPEDVLADLDTAGQAGILHPSGGHLSYIPNAGLYSAALGEFLAAGLNRYTGIAGAAPGFSAIEHGVVDWMTSLFDLGPS